jgi:hypothetical protein
MTEPKKTNESETPQSKSKVKRLLSEHEMEEFGNRLVDRWTRRENRSSLRELADDFNQQLLRSELEGGSLDPLDGEVENIYHILTNDETTSGTRQQARSRLEQAGIDVEKLENEFVSYQSVRTYLRKVRKVDPPDKTRGTESQLETKRTTIQQLVTRLRKVTEGTISELKEAGHLTLGEFDVSVSVRVHCRDCDSRVSVIELLSRGSCQCEA